MSADKNSVFQQALKDYQPQTARVMEQCIDDIVLPNGIKEDAFFSSMKSPFGLSLKEEVRFLIGVGSINYQFWSKEPGSPLVRYQNKGHVGALGMFEGFVGVFEELFLGESASQMGAKAHQSKEWGLNHSWLFSHFGQISGPDGRIEILEESLNPECFEAVWDCITGHIKESPFDVQLAQKIANILPKSYQDPYLKKIQLVLYEMAACFREWDFPDRCDITVAADYQIPKVLEALGLLHYSPELSKLIADEELLDSGGPFERAIRSATIIACQNISAHHHISIAQLDRYLWLMRNDFPGKKFHLTKTRHY